MAQRAASPAEVTRCAANLARTTTLALRSSWKAIVRSIIMGRSTFTAEKQQRPLDISRHVGAIGELVKDSREPFTTPDGSPLVTTQAATVLAGYRHIAWDRDSRGEYPRAVVEAVDGPATRIDPLAHL